jgi:hypothetical protein
MIRVWDLVYLEKICTYLSQGAMSCCLYKHRLIVYHQQHNQSNLFFSYFYTSFLFFSFLLRLDLLAAATTLWVIMDLAPPPSQTPLVQEKDVLVGGNGAPDSCQTRWNRTLRFVLFRAEAFSSCLVLVWIVLPSNAGRTLGCLIMHWANVADIKESVMRARGHCE